MNQEKNLILLDEYKRGFSEVEELVHGFKGITNDSQKTFLDMRKDVFQKQLQQIDRERNQIYEDIKKVLVKVNSRLLALKDMEKYIGAEIERCQQTEKIIIDKNEESEKDEEQSTETANDTKEVS